MKLLTQEIIKRLPPLYSQEKEADPMVHAKFFDPSGGSTWFITEYDGKDLFFGFARLNDWNDEAELGYISKSELESVRGRFGLGIERDIHFTPQRLSKCKEELGITA